MPSNAKREKSLYVFFSVPGLGGVMFAAYNIGTISAMRFKDKLCWAFSFRDHSGDHERNAFFYERGSMAAYVHDDIGFERLGEWAVVGNDSVRDQLSVTPGSELIRQYNGVRTLVIEPPNGRRSAMLCLTSSFSDPEDLGYDGEYLIRPRIIGATNECLPTFAIPSDMNMKFLYDMCDAYEESFGLEPSRFTPLLEGDVFEELPF